MWHVFRGYGMVIPAARVAAKTRQEREAMNPADTRLAVRPAEAARMLGVTRTRIFTEVREGRLRTAKVGRCRIIPIAELRDWLDRQTSGAAA